MSSLIPDAEKTAMVADFQSAVNTWLRPLQVYQEAQTLVVNSDPNWNPLEAWNQNAPTFQVTPVVSTVSGRILWNNQQDYEYATPYVGRGLNQGQIKVKDQTDQACRLKVDPSGYNLLLNAKQVQIDGVLMYPQSQPRPHGLFWPTYYTFYFVRTVGNP